MRLMDGITRQRTSDALTPLHRIRVDTALSRYPIHRLAKRGDVQISFKTVTETGEVNILWDVSYNSKFGQPGPTAYKLDTLVINRRIDECSRPLPEVIKLGSLNSIIKDLGNASAGENTKSVKAALHQNASTYINAKIRYKTRSGAEKWAEIGYTRYSVVFTGEQLPDGRAADAVYIVLNAAYRELLNQSEVRPLDYNYLLDLAPGPQRLYELLSSKMYGAIANGRASARLFYSEFCLHAPQTRYYERAKMQKQMYKVHVPHIHPEPDALGQRNNYIQSVEYRPTKDREGKPNWELLYTPGPRAYREYEAFARKTGVTPIPPSLQAAKQSKPVNPTQQMLDLGEGSSLLATLIRLGVLPKRAEALLANLHQGQDIEGQLEYLEYCINHLQTGKIRNPAGFCIKFIESNSPVPANFVTSRQCKLHEQQYRSNMVDDARMAELRVAYDKHVGAEVERHIAAMPPSEYELHVAAELQDYAQRFKSVPRVQLRETAERAFRAKLRNELALISFDKFCQRAS